MPHTQQRFQDGKDIRGYAELQPAFLSDDLVGASNQLLP